MTGTEKTAAAASDVTTKTPLSDMMLAMDVVDTLRHRNDLVIRELAEDDREAQLIERLRTIYREQGIAVPDHILKQGVEALKKSQFTYQPAKRSISTRLARLYVSRGKWGRPTFWLILIAAILTGGYQFAYTPYQQQQNQNAALELSTGIPAQMETLYQTIFNETKVQSAANNAAELLAQGRTAAAEGDRTRATRILSDLTHIRDTIRQEYALQIVNRAGIDTGIWTSPEGFNDATSFYIVVEAIDPEGKKLTLPIKNEESQLIENVNIWAVRVSERIYDRIRDDKIDDGIIQQDIVALKEFGYLSAQSIVPTLGGAITQW